jgi:hypothetical protein
MDVQLTEERRPQLAEYAERRGQDVALALDEIVAHAVEWDRREYQATVEGIRRGYDDMKAGRTRSVAESFAELRESLISRCAS